jgi:hypothetical protein
MRTREPAIVSRVDTSWVVDWAIVPEMLSTSFDRRLMRSPWLQVSKRDTGRRWSFPKRSFLNDFTISCEAPAMSQPWETTSAASRA